ncbi:hypothetical protein DDW11_04955 [Sulfolobus sp. SCGC AB-777_G06]|nr:hypothetical protein DDW11_04955 [Sulfolobus sp. SCGC AB-777_G06]
MKTGTTVLLSVILLILPTVPAYALNYPAFLVASAIGLIIVLYIMYSNRTWETLKGKVVGTYFSGVFAVGVTLGIFFSAYSKPKLFAETGLIFIIPFIVQFLLLLKDILPSMISKDLLYFSNGYVPFLLVLIIGSVIGRFLSSFYPLIILYSGTLVVAILVFLYFRRSG